jgi:hypothetical protein
MEIWKTGGSFRDHTQTRDLYETSDILKPDETNIKFENIDWAYISNLGFVDGYLHIQTSIPIDMVNDKYLLRFGFVNEANEVVSDGDLRIDFIKYENRYGYDGSNLFYKYSDTIYESITDIEQLKGLSVVIDTLEQGRTFEGSWEFSFDIPEKITTEFAVDKEISINGELIKLDTVSLSPLGIILDLPVNIARNYRYDDTACVIYEDGTIIDLNETLILGNQDLSTLKFGGNVVEVTKVKTIVINGEVITVTPVS